MTDPAGTVALADCVIAPTVRPAVVIAAEAAACVSPTMFGTATCGGPDEITSATALPTVTCVAAVGVWLMTDPAGTVALDDCVIAPTVRPAVVIAAEAAACVSPTTSGTGTCGGPDDITSAIARRTVACAAAIGF